MYHESHYIRSKIETNGTTRLAGPKTMPTRGSYAPYIYISNAIIGMNESKILKLELFDVLARVNTWMRRCDDARSPACPMRGGSGGGVRPRLPGRDDLDHRPVQAAHRPPGGVGLRHQPLRDLRTGDVVGGLVLVLGDRVDHELGAVHGHHA